MMVHSPDASDFFPSTPTKLVVTSLVVFLASIVIAVSFLWEKSKLPTYPTNSTWLQRKRQFRINGSKVIEQGFVEAASGVFRVVYLNGTYLTIISPQHWLSLCKKKDTEIAPAYRQFFWSNRTGAAFEDQFLYKLVLAQMRTFDRNLPEIAESFDMSVRNIVKESNCSSYKSFRVAETITRIFARASWKLILSDEYDDSIVDVFFNYVRAHSAAQLKLRSCYPALHWIYSYFIPEIRDLHEHLLQATAILSPVLSQARGQLNENENGDGSIISWLLREVGPRRYADDKYLTNILLAYGITFVFSPSPIGTQLIHEMAFRSDFCAQMRSEAIEVFGAAKRSWDKNTLRRLTKLDSFCKETHRHHPSAASNLMKRVDKTVTLPNGVVLPQGTVFEVAIQPADFRDPRLHHPDKWDGFRFHEMRRLEGFSDKAAREYEWGTSTRDDIDFGYGMHHCPGNAVGCNMLKIFLTKLLEMYDLRPEEGASERYKDVHLGQYIKPDTTRTVMMRRRAGIDESQH